MSFLLLRHSDTNMWQPLPNCRPMVAASFVHFSTISSQMPSVITSVPSTLLHPQLFYILFAHWFKAYPYATRGATIHTSQDPSSLLLSRTTQFFRFHTFALRAQLLADTKQRIGDTSQDLKKANCSQRPETRTWRLQAQHILIRQ